jgi:hypothetical protein
MSYTGPMLSKMKQLGLPQITFTVDNTEFSRNPFHDSGEETTTQTRYSHFV